MNTKLVSTSKTLSCAAALLLGLALGSATSALAQLGLPDTTADAVYGQGSFTSITANRGQTNPSENTTSGPTGLATDPSGGLYLADASNNRVLFYPGGAVIPTRVYGQSDSFQTRTVNKGGVSAGSLSNPAGVAVDRDGGLYVADLGNNRVLHYAAGSTNSDRVYGQNGSFTTASQNQGQTAPSRTSLFFPIAVAVDKDGGLYVADFSNHRILHYPNGSTIADRVYGQGGDFTTRTVNKGGISATSLNTPEGVNIDSTDGIYIVDRENHRVLHFSGASTIADRVYGQGNSFNSATPNLGGASNESLNAPIQMTADNAGGLYIADFGNNRVLHYPAVSIGIADRVYGQGNTFNTVVPNKGGTPASADSLQNPFGVAVDANGTLFISDLSNHRVLRYDAPPPPTPAVSSITTNPNPAVAAQRFTFTIAGSNFNPATVIVEFNGPGCSPCSVTNSLLTTKTATSLAGGVTLTSGGNYTVTARNGTGAAVSSGVPLTVSTGGTGSTTCGCDFNSDSRVDISDVISLVRLVQSNTAPACRNGSPFSIADVIHVVNVVQGNAACRL